MAILKYAVEDQHGKFAIVSIDWQRIDLRGEWKHALPNTVMYNAHSVWSMDKPGWVKNKVYLDDMDLLDLLSSRGLSFGDLREATRVNACYKDRPWLIAYEEPISGFYCGSNRSKDSEHPPSELSSAPENNGGSVKMNADQSKAFNEEVLRLVDDLNSLEKGNTIEYFRSLIKKLEDTRATLMRISSQTPPENIPLINPTDSQS